MGPQDGSIAGVSVFVLFSALAVLAFLWTTAKTVGFERGIVDLRTEVAHLIKQKEKRLKATRGEEDEDLVGVTIIDEDEASTVDPGRTAGDASSADEESVRRAA